MKHCSRIFVAGGSGMVGSSIIRALRKRKFENLIYPTSKELDLSDQKSVKIFFESNNIDYVFLAAARVGGILENNAKKAVEDIINLPASKINKLGVFRPRKPNNLELDFVNETRSNKQIKWKVQDDPSSKSGKSFSLQASNPGAFKNFQSFLKEKGVPLRNIKNIQKKR